MTRFTSNLAEALQLPAIALWLQSDALVGRVAERSRRAVTTDAMGSSRFYPCHPRHPWSIIHAMQYAQHGGRPAIFVRSSQSRLEIFEPWTF
jgi:hypothetical protein